MPLSIDLNDEEKRRLDAVAVRTGRPTEDVVHDAISRHLDEIEEIAWAERATRAWQESDRMTRPIGEIRRELGH